MTISDDSSDRITLPESNILIPVSTDKSKLEWDGNDATILGLLHEVVASRHGGRSRRE